MGVFANKKKVNQMHEQLTPTCSGGDCSHKLTCEHAIKISYSSNKIYPVSSGAYCGYYVKVTPSVLDKIQSNIKHKQTAGA